jgi:5-formyltetrahydrofolate cyclo-ligase
VADSDVKTEAMLWTRTSSKRRLRKTAMDVRAAANATAGPLSGDLLAAQFLENVPVSGGTVVAGYWPIRDEISPLPLLRRLHEAGTPVTLPAVTEKGGILTFRAWEPDIDLEDGPYGTSHPPSGDDEREPDVVVVPMLAFDDDGNRLGYGAGYYDRVLASLRRTRPVVAVGIAFEAQRVKSLPHDENDQRLDWVATENATRRFG